jgi:hypothetical protein
LRSGVVFEMAIAGGKDRRLANPPVYLRWHQQMASAR